MIMAAFWRRLGIPGKLITDPAYDKILPLNTELGRLVLENYLQDDIHKWTIWLTLVVSIAFVALWWLAADRRRFLEVTLFGTLMLIMSTTFDAAGFTLNLWVYPDKVMPLLPALTFDYIVVPVAFLLVYQKYGRWGPFIIASVLVAAVYSFIAEPIVVWLNLTLYLKWHYAYSFVVYIGMAVVAKLLMTLFIRHQNAA